MKVLIFGLGLNNGGVGSSRYFAKRGDEVRVTDLKSEEILKPSIDQLKDFPNISYTLGEHKNEDIDWADLIIKNPAVKPNNPYIEYAEKIGKRVEQDIGIFLEYVKPEQIIGVTGTKGKSTSVSLIYEALRTGARTFHIEGGIVLAGNIGKSVLDIIPDIKPDTLVVLEISSFQLEAFDQHKISPKYAVITNIYEDHLNYYKNMDEYISTKKVIGKYQTKEDFLFINKEDEIINNPEFLSGLNGQQILYSVSDLPKDFNPILKGKHNLSNMAAAFAVGKIFGVDEKSILHTLSTFKGVPLRMELVKEWNGVKIINDTTATGPDAGIQAIKTASHMTSGKVVLISGGMNKGLDYTKYVTIVHDFVKNVFFLEGDATDQILASLKRMHTPGVEVQIHEPYNDLENLLTDVKKVAKPGDTILFSPAATSFNLFQNEFDRGRKFNTAVEKVFND